MRMSLLQAEEFSRLMAFLRKLRILSPSTLAKITEELEERWS